jgi:hypothetical protein
MVLGENKPMLLACHDAGLFHFKHKSGIRRRFERHRSFRKLRGNKCRPSGKKHESASHTDKLAGDYLRDAAKL